MLPHPVIIIIILIILLLSAHQETASLHHYPDQSGMKERAQKTTISTLTMIKLILECRGNGDIAALLGCLSAGSEDTSTNTIVSLLHNCSIPFQPESTMKLTDRDVTTFPFFYSPFYRLNTRVKTVIDVSLRFVTTPLLWQSVLSAKC